MNDKFMKLKPGDVVVINDEEYRVLRSIAENRVHWPEPHKPPPWWERLRTPKIP